MLYISHAASFLTSAVPRSSQNRVETSCFVVVKVLYAENEFNAPKFGCEFAIFFRVLNPEATEKFHFRIKGKAISRYGTPEPPGTCLSEPLSCCPLPFHYLKFGGPWKHFLLIFFGLFSHSHYIIF